MSKKLTCPNCGSTEEFEAQQVLHTNVIIDGSRNYQRNPGYDLEASIYESGDPFGPYACLNCKCVFDND